MYSDNISSPSAGKPIFSLPEYLAGDGVGAPGVSPARDGGAVVVFKLESSRSPQHQNGAHPLKGVTPLPARLPLLAALCLLVLAVGSALAILRHRNARVLKTGVPGPELVGVLVTEMEQREPGRAPEVLGRDVRVAAAAGLPVPFSADPNCGAYVVAPGVGIPAVGELFCVFPQDNGDVLVEGAEGVMVGGQPVNTQRARVDARDGAVVEFGKRSFQIRPVFAAFAEGAAPAGRGL